MSTRSWIGPRYYLSDKAFTFVLFFSGNKSAMKQSVTSRWVATLPEHTSQEPIPLPSGAVRVLPDPITQNQRRKENHSAPSHIKHSVSKKCNPGILRSQKTQKSNTWDVTRQASEATQSCSKPRTSRPRNQTTAQPNQPHGILNTTRQKHASCLKNKVVHIQQNPTVQRSQDVQQEHSTSGVNMTSLNSTSSRKHEVTPVEWKLKSKTFHLLKVLKSNKERIS